VNEDRYRIVLHELSIRLNRAFVDGNVKERGILPSQHRTRDLLGFLPFPLFFSSNLQNNRIGISCNDVGICW